MDLADVDGDGLHDLVVATAGRKLLCHRRIEAAVPEWEMHRVPLPRTAGTGKGVHVGDIDLDGQADIVFSCENAGGRMGVGGLSLMLSATASIWLPFPISTSTGSKFDLVQLEDLDGDGDLDVITTEEGIDLGVIWYVNPTR
jgi:hypothetical protein